MMRRMIGAALCAILTACGQPSTQSTPAAPHAFPRATAAYSGTYIVGHAGQVMTIYADRPRVRVQGPPPAEARAPGVKLASVMEQGSRRLVSFRIGPDAPRVAMVVNLDTLGEAASFFDLDSDHAAAKPL